MSKLKINEEQNKKRPRKIKLQSSKIVRYTSFQNFSKPRFYIMIHVIYTVIEYFLLASIYKGREREKEIIYF